MGVEHEDVAGEPGAGLQERVQLPLVLEMFHPTKGANDPLPGLAAVPEVLDDLKVSVGAALFFTEEHGDLLLSPR